LEVASEVHKPRTAFIPANRSEKVLWVGRSHLVSFSRLDRFSLACPPFFAPGKEEKEGGAGGNLRSMVPPAFSRRLSDGL
jgi:hypothetical protein